MADSDKLTAASSERSVLETFGNIYRAAVANPEETRILVGTWIGTSAGTMVGTAGPWCGPLAVVCVPIGAAAGFGAGFLAAGAIGDAIADPRNRWPAYFLSAQLYDVALNGEDFAP